MDRCKNCKELIFKFTAGILPHRCKPAWRVCDRDYLDSGLDHSIVAHAHDEEDAANLHAQAYNEDSDYALMNGGELKLAIWPEGGDKVNAKFFECFAESSIDYSVNEID